MTGDVPAAALLRIGKWQDRGAKEYNRTCRLVCTCLRSACFAYTARHASSGPCALSLRQAIPAGEGQQARYKGREGRLAGQLRVWIGQAAGRVTHGEGQAKDEGQLCKRSR